MDSVLKFSIPGTPQTKLRPRFSRHKGKVHTYNSQRDEDQTMRWKFKARMNGSPLEGPIAIDMKFYMSIPKSKSKKIKEKMRLGEIKHTIKPDCDNLVKKPTDCMNGIVYLDDKQIYKLTAEKLYGENPRTEITVWQESSQVSDSENGELLK